MTCARQHPFLLRENLQERSPVLTSVLKKSPRMEFLNNLWAMGARNRVGIGLTYRPARLHGLAEFIPWNRFLGSIMLKNAGSVKLDINSFFSWNFFSSENDSFTVFIPLNNLF